MNVRIFLTIKKFNEPTLSILLKAINGSIINDEKNHITIAYNEKDLYKALNNFHLSIGACETNFLKSQEVLIKNLFNKINFSHK